MSRNCLCKHCGRPTDCNGDVCELCLYCTQASGGVQLKLEDDLTSAEPGSV